MATPTLQEIYAALVRVESKLDEALRSLNVTHLKVDKAQTKVLVAPHRSSTGKGASKK